MASTKYTYSIADDTLNGKVDNDALAETIQESDIVTALDYINTEADVLDIWFKSELSSGDETILDGLVSDHDGEALIPDPTEVTAVVTEQPEPHPFAAPLYRTKNDATTSIETCNKNSTKTIDFKLTAERYVSGGAVTIENPEFGDYITAEVYDKDSAIPEPYRAALCENWPSVAKYIEKEWVPMGEGTVWGTNLYISHTLDTRPLQAKISANLYLRITYNAVDAGSDRKIIVNYNLTKKL